MCHFVTMVLPPGADAERVQQVLGSFRRGFEILENRHVAKLLKPREVYFLPSPKHCDCGTALGSAQRLSEDAPDFAREVEKRRRRGWSETKIARWLEQKRNHQQAAIERAEEVAGSGSDLDDWVNILRELRMDAGLGYAGILLHWYDGPLSERIDATRKRLRNDEHLRTALRSIDEDVLYIVT